MKSLASLAAVLVLAALATSSLFVEEVSGKAVLFATAAVWLGVMLSPDAGGAVPLWRLLVWSLGVGGGCLAVAWSGFGIEPLGATSLGLLVAVQVTLSLAVLCIVRDRTNDVIAKQGVMLLLAALCLAPLCLGPLLVNAGPGAASFVVAMSPASHFAGVLEFDYLRSNWFYENTPFGGLRYEYPGTLMMSLWYLLGTLSTVLLGLYLKSFTLRNKTP